VKRGRRRRAEIDRSSGYQDEEVDFFFSLAIMGDGKIGGYNRETLKKKTFFLFTFEHRLPH
jgi:hypothetical protein